MDVKIANAPAHAFFNAQLPANAINSAFALQHEFPVTGCSLSKTITVSLSSHSALTAVQDFFVVDNLDVDIIMGKNWLEVCRGSTGAHHKTMFSYILI